MKKKSEQIRVYVSDKELIERIAGTLRQRNAGKVSTGQVVADALQSLLAARPDLAAAIADAQAVQP